MRNDAYVKASAERAPLDRETLDPQPVPKTAGEIALARAVM